LHPFDLKTVLFAKHAQHVVLIHFPIALFIIGVLFENEVVIEAASGDKKFAITILDQTSSGIYACVAEPGKNGGTAKAQSVIFLKRKDASALLKARESWREFDACPVIGESDSTTSAYGD